MNGQTLVAIATFVSAIGGLTLSAFALIRNWQQQAQQATMTKASTDAKEAASASSVGLKFLEKALARQQTEIIRQEGLLATVQQQLRESEARRLQEEVRYRAEIAELRKNLEDLTNAK